MSLASHSRRALGSVPLLLTLVIEDSISLAWLNKVPWIDGDFIFMSYFLVKRVVIN